MDNIKTNEILNNIYTFWFKNKKYWIPITQLDKEKADKIIYELFYNVLNIENLLTNFIYQDKNYVANILGITIYIDQFYKHFIRHIPKVPLVNLNNLSENIMSEEQLFKKRLILCNILSNVINDNFINKLNEEELIFILMPFKHCYKFKFVLNNVFNWCNLYNIKICENTIISKFYNDTCNKYYIPINYNKDLNSIKLNNYYNLQYFDYNNCKYELFNNIYSLNDRINVCEYYPFTQLNK